MSVFKAGMIFLFLIAVEVGVAIITTGQGATITIQGCTTTDNYTSCQSVAKSSFLDNLLHQSVQGFEGVPLVYNVIWLSITAFLLSLAVIEFVRQFIPTVPGG